LIKIDASHAWIQGNVEQELIQISPLITLTFYLGVIASVRRSGYIVSNLLTGFVIWLEQLHFNQVEV
jgi:hypothetical protein